MSIKDLNNIPFIIRTDKVDDFLIRRKINLN